MLSNVTLILRIKCQTILLHHNYIITSSFPTEFLTTPNLSLFNIVFMHKKACFNLTQGNRSMTGHKGMVDFILVALYYLLQVNKYVTKTLQPNSKHTVQFKVKDVLIFHSTSTSSPCIFPKILLLMSSSLHLMPP